MRTGGNVDRRTGGQEDRRTGGKEDMRILPGTLSSFPQLQVNVAAIHVYQVLVVHLGPGVREYKGTSISIWPSFTQP